MFYVIYTRVTTCIFLPWPKQSCYHNFEIVTCRSTGDRNNLIYLLNKSHSSGKNYEPKWSLGVECWCGRRGGGGGCGREGSYKNIDVCSSIRVHLFPVGSIRHVILFCINEEDQINLSVMFRLIKSTICFWSIINLTSPNSFYLQYKQSKALIWYIEFL